MIWNKKYHLVCGVRLKSLFIREIGLEIFDGGEYGSIEEITLEIHE